MQRAVGKKMTWDKLPPFEEGTSVIDLVEMSLDLDIPAYYCPVSVINGMDENGKALSTEFSVEMDDDSAGWSIEQGTLQIDGTYKVDGKSATLLLGIDMKGSCEIIARDGQTELRKTVELPETEIVVRGRLIGGSTWGYYKLSDIVNDEYIAVGVDIPMSSPDVTHVPVVEETDTDDNARPVRTITHNSVGKWDGDEWYNETYSETLTYESDGMGGWNLIKEEKNGYYLSLLGEGDVDSGIRKAQILYERLVGSDPTVDKENNVETYAWHYFNDAPTVYEDTGGYDEVLETWSGHYGVHVLTWDEDNYIIEKWDYTDVAWHDYDNVKLRVEGKSNGVTIEKTTNLGYSLTGIYKMRAIAIA
jgi:hypothetical protein